MPSNKNTLIEERVRELGFRMTAQRALILEAIGRAGEHATFEEIYDQVLAVAPKINRTTVYRNLETFSRYRLIHGNQVAGGNVYELLSSDPHHHLICHNCWTDQKIEEDVLKDFYSQIDQEHGFLVLSEHMIFMGLCEECRQNRGDSLGQFKPHPKFQSKALKEEQTA